MKPRPTYTDLWSHVMIAFVFDFKILAALVLLAVSGLVQANGVTYAYDGLGRIIQANYANGGSIQYAYDAVGNRISRTITAPINQSPAANAGADQTVMVGIQVALNGTASNDPDHGPALLAYAWSQISGPAVTLGGATTVGPTFTPAQIGDYVFGLVVNDGMAGSPQSTVTVHVGKANQTIGFGAAPTVSVGGTGMVSATGGASGNPVTFSSITTGVCAVSGNTVIGLAAGTCIIAANQAGTANYNAAPQSTQTFTVGKGNQTINFGAKPTVLVGNTGMVSATGGASGNPVIFSSATPSVCAVNGSTVTGVSAGLCTLFANQVGNANYSAAPQATLSFSIMSGFVLTVGNANVGGGTVVSDVGGIACGGTCSSSFASGLAVNLTAIPVDGYQFTGWGGDCRVCGYGNACTVTMDAAKSCAASFDVFKRHRPLWRRVLLPQ